MSVKLPSIMNYDLLQLILSFIAVVVIVIFLIVVIVLLTSKKPAKHLWAEMIYELVYNVIGAKALLEDIVMRERNEVVQLPMASGKVAVITGGARGIGVEVVKKLVRYDAHVVIGCRNVEAGTKLLEAIREEGIESGDVDVLALNLKSLASVKSFALAVKEKYPKIHLLINNAGIMFGPYSESDDGFESQFAVNYLSHFYLTHLLLPELIAAGVKNNNARVVNVSSCAHTVGDINFDDINHRKLYIPSAAYAQSKLAQVLFTNYLKTLMRENGNFVGSYSVHPGIVDTDLFNNTIFKNLAGPWLISKLFKTPVQGAMSILYACLSRQLEIASGTYISNCEIMPTSQIAYSTDLQGKMFEFTRDLLDIKEFGKE